MKRFVWIMVCFIPMFSFAQFKLWENENGVLRWKFSDSLRYTDTVLADGTKSKLYKIPWVTGENFIHFEFPDGVEIVVFDESYFPYPSGLKPGIYNFSPFVDVSRNKDGKISYKYKIWDVPSESFEVASATTATSSPPNQQHSPASCTFRGKHLNADVKIVNSNADFKVRVVGSNEFLTVRIVSSSWTTNLCGQWRWVEHGEDFTVQFVEYDEDFTIRITN